MIATDMVEQVELTESWKALEQAGAGPRAGSRTTCRRSARSSSRSSTKGATTVTEWPSTPRRRDPAASAKGLGAAASGHEGYETSSLVLACFSPAIPESRPDRWPREESNLRTQLRRLPLCPLSYGASAGA